MISNTLFRRVLCRMSTQSPLDQRVASLLSSSPPLE